MTTFRGFIRELDRASRRYQREQERQERENRKAYQAHLKQQEIENAKETVLAYDNFITSLTSLHKNCSEKINWLEIKNTIPPTQPVLKNTNEIKAKNKLDTYTPSFIDKIFKWTEKRKKTLHKKIEDAKILDTKLFEQENNKYNQDLIIWKEEQSIANGILNKNNEICIECFKKFFNKEYFSDFISDLTLIFHSDAIEINIKINDISIIPNEILSLTYTDKMSRKKMPFSKKLDIYQDYICSTTLRIAREIYAILSYDKSLINVNCNLLNESTGYKEEKTILSSIIESKKLNSINFIDTDASMCIKNFIHNINFSKTKGFSSVEKLTLT
ncbi:MAG: hypothetical protein VB048_07450 [Bacteroidaceae bacterium]|nr:hypothetical protein [Bacteroidaceae bacterium]